MTYPKSLLPIFWSGVKKLPLLSEIAIRGSYSQETVNGLELQMFGDSLQDVFSAIAFLRSKFVTKGIETTELAFAFGRARFAPMKCLTNPKLELKAALLSSQLRQGVQSPVSVDIKRCFMWTDSTTVLPCLHSLEKQPACLRCKPCDWKSGTDESWRIESCTDGCSLCRRWHWGTDCHCSVAVQLVRRSCFSEKS